MNTIYVFVNGIMTFPGQSKNWTGRAVTWTQVTTQAKADKVEYWAGYLSRVVGQHKRAYKLYRTLAYYRGWNIVLVGHSNGADVITDCLQGFYGLAPIQHVHLVCGACESDFARNGLNMALAERRVGEVSIYCAGKDKALKWAHTWLGRLLGYGCIGLEGPTRVRPALASRVHVIQRGWEDYGHSDCWGDDRFDDTMRMITGTEIY